MLTKREKERLDAGVEYAKSLKLDIQDALLASMHFSKGMEYGENKFIEKACERITKLHNWPTQYEEYAKLQEEFIKEFRKAMEE